MNKSNYLLSTIRLCLSRKQHTLVYKTKQDNSKLIKALASAGIIRFFKQSGSLTYLVLNNSLPHQIKLSKALISISIQKLSKEAVRIGGNSIDLFNTNHGLLTHFEIIKKRVGGKPIVHLR